MDERVSHEGGETIIPLQIFAGEKRETLQTTDRQGRGRAIASIDYRKGMQCLCGSALADSLENRLPLDVVVVVGLELGRDAGERALEGLLGGSVDHLGL